MLLTTSRTLYRNERLSPPDNVPKALQETVHSPFVMGDEQPVLFQDQDAVQEEEEMNQRSEPVSTVVVPCFLLCSELTGLVINPYFIFLDRWADENKSTGKT